ncbi:MAG: carbon-nitrogen hydrolase family protein [Telluria sp.]
MTHFTIASIQMPILAAGSNLESMALQVDRLLARFPAVQMVLFSELCAHGPSKTCAEPAGGPTEQFFQRLAARHGIWLLPGSLYETDGDAIYNSAPVIGPDGQVVTRYRKMFPFLPFEVGVSPGDACCVFDIPAVGRFGVSICYDKFFPETTRTMAMLGAEVILHPTMTDTIDRELELSIARTNAAVNQCYFFDINGVGECANGRSIIVGPSGEIVHQAGNAAEVMPIEIDLGRVRRQRETGLMQLGQPLKSFRDTHFDFTAAQRGPVAETYLQSLGPIAKARRA